MKPSVEIRRLVTLPSDIRILQNEAAEEGFRFVDKLIKEWEGATNRFARPGEILVGAFQGARLVAVCGLNIDPHLENAAVCRLRHLYLLKEMRRQGIASRLVRHLLDAASGSFGCARLRTDTKEGAIFYETLGFLPAQSPTATHVIAIGNSKRRGMDGYDLSLVTEADDWAAYHQIRRSVLFEARGRFDYVEDGPEELKQHNLSLLLKFHGAPVGTVRLDTKPERKAIVRLVAITFELQRQGHGSVMMNRVEDLANMLGFKELRVHAAPDAVGFYLKLGFSKFDFEEGQHQSV